MTSPRPYSPAMDICMRHFDDECNGCPLATACNKPWPSPCTIEAIDQRRAEMRDEAREILKKIDGAAS